MLTCAEDPTINVAQSACFHVLLLGSGENRMQLFKALRALTRRCEACQGRQISLK